MEISLPTGFTMDTNSMAGGGGWDRDPAGFAILEDSGVIGGIPGIINTRTSTKILVKYTDDDDAGKLVGRVFSNSAPWIWASSDTVTGRFTVPVTS